MPRQAKSGPPLATGQPKSSEQISATGDWPCPRPPGIAQQMAPLLACHFQALNRPCQLPGDSLLRSLMLAKDPLCTNQRLSVTFIAQR